MKFIFILFLSFFSLFTGNNYLKAAERINIKFEDMTIPLTIDQLSKLETYKNDSTEVMDWFMKNGFSKVLELSKFLNFPVFKEDGLNRKLLNSWVGKKVLNEMSNTILVPNDKKGIEVFNTIENLLDIQKEVSTLDILKALPSREIILDIDNLIIIISSWKKELALQQNLILELNALEKTNYQLFINKHTNKNSNLTKENKIIISQNRTTPLEVELWKDDKNSSEKDLIIFMPGLGGNIDNFRWIAIELSKRGWPVILLDHKGSNSETFLEVIEGQEVIPSSAEFFSYRLRDLNTVIKAHTSGSLGLKNKSYILMGHSLGALIAFLYEGNIPKEGIENRCDLALKDFAITNLSKLLQCQINEIALPQMNNFKKANAIIGFNTFGSLIWPKGQTSGIDLPILLIGGTYDLITPLISEQFKVFLSTENNPLNRFLIIEGASHFSPIRINKSSAKTPETNDVFKISKPFIGSNPSSVQDLSLKVIIKFLDNIKDKSELNVIKNQRENNLDFHILDRNNLKELSKN